MLAYIIIIMHVELLLYKRLPFLQPCPPARLSPYVLPPYSLSMYYIPTEALFCPFAFCEYFYAPHHIEQSLLKVLFATTAPIKCAIYTAISVVAVETQIGAGAPEHMWT